MRLSISEVWLPEEAVQDVRLGPDVVAGEGHEMPALGTTRTSSLRTFWAGHHEALRLLHAVCSALSLPFLTHLKLAWGKGAGALGTASL